MAFVRSALLCSLSVFVQGQSTTTTTTDLGIPQYDEVTSQDEEVKASERLSILNASTWAVPGRVVRCPVHQAAMASINSAGAVEMDTAFNITKMYSILEGQIPQAAISSGLYKYDGLEMHFSSSKLQHFKVRLSDDRADARFIAAVKANGDGEHNLWLKWSDFHGEELMMGGIRPCTENAPCRNINHGSITSVAILIPMIQDQAYVESKFTIQSVTLDVLASGGQNSTESTQVKPASEAEEIRFEEPDVFAIDASQSHGAWFVALLSLSFVKFF
mmetsp:Transcript_74058/g.90905  ORF Transcript_74058/g.90905 Transcript_74058/m.90905 type:complete len:274 (+) Transcript_74058:43-864(+)